jgi:hypothetical protein
MMNFRGGVGGLAPDHTPYFPGEAGKYGTVCCTDFKKSVQHVPAQCIFPDIGVGADLPGKGVVCATE